MIEMDAAMEELRPHIRIIGVGGAGGNAVANMIRNDVRGVDFVVANTDAQALRASPVDYILQLGRRTTEGLGAGSSAETGRLAAEESLAEIDRMLEGAHMVFIAAGLGGGTGTGAAPVIARAARAKGILTVGVVTKPFGFEGSRRGRAAQAGLEVLQQHVDTLIVVPNQNLFRIARPATTFREAFDLADEILQQGVRGITDLMVMPGLINLDFADIRTVMRDMGRAMMGTGEAGGDDRAIRAAEAAVANPLVDEAIKGARGLIISISGGDDLGLLEVDEAASYIKELVDPDADIIWGSSFNPELNGRIRVSIVATGLDMDEGVRSPAPLPIVAAAPSLTAMPLMPVRSAQPVPVRELAAAERVSTAEPASPPFQPAPAPRVHPPQPALQGQLQMDRPALKLIPPTREEMAAAEAERRLTAELARRGPSLFDRMAMAARFAATGSQMPAGPAFNEADDDQDRARSRAYA